MISICPPRRFHFVPLRNRITALACAFTIKHPPAFAATAREMAPLVGSFHVLVARNLKILRYAMCARNRICQRKFADQAAGWPSRRHPNSLGAKFPLHRTPLPSSNLCMPASLLNSLSILPPFSVRASAGCPRALASLQSGTLRLLNRVPAA